MSDNGSPNNMHKPEDTAQQSEHLNIKVTDNNNEVFFKIKRNTKLSKLQGAYATKVGKDVASIRWVVLVSQVQLKCRLYNNAQRARMLFPFGRFVCLVTSWAHFA